MVDFLSWAACRNYLAIVAACCIPGGAAQAQLRIHLSVTEPRPLAEALDQLQKQTGIPVNYEDPRYECPAEIEDVAARVQNAAQRAAHPNARILVPRAGTLALDATLPAIPGPADLLPVVNQLQQLHQARGYAGRFVVKTVGSVLTVQPTAARGSDCRWTEVSAMMDRRITFPAQAREAASTLMLILSTLSHESGVKVGLANFPVLTFANGRTTLGANSEPAGAVLFRLFDQLSVPGTPQLWSYHLLFDPGLRYYMLNIATAAPLRQPASGLPF